MGYIKYASWVTRDSVHPANNYIFISRHCLFFLVLNMLWMGNVFWGLFCVVYITIKGERVGWKYLSFPFGKPADQKKKEWREGGRISADPDPLWRALSAWERRKSRLASCVIAIRDILSPKTEQQKTKRGKPDPAPQFFSPLRASFCSLGGLPPFWGPSVNKPWLCCGLRLQQATWSTLPGRRCWKGL